MRLAAARIFITLPIFKPMQTNYYYRPASAVGRQTMYSRTRDGYRTLNNGERHVRSWPYDGCKTDSNLFRKPEKFNGYYTTKKLRSDYWRINRDSKVTSSPTDLSVVHDIVLASNGNERDNLKLFNVSRDLYGEPSKLYELQSITVPGKPIDSVSLLPSLKYPADRYAQDHDQLLLTGHQDGIVNLISTSREEGKARIIKRYKHGKYLSLNTSETLDNWLQSSFASLSIRKLKPWRGSGFASIINDTFFIYELDKSKAPQYLQGFPGLESFAINNFHNSYLIALSGSKFGNSRVALLDLRSGRNGGNLYIPDGNKTATNSNLRTPAKLSGSRECVWIDEFRVANCFNDVVKIWDIRSTDGENQCDIMPMGGCVEFLTYHAPTKTLYTGDDQGHIISWDLHHLSGIRKCIPSQGTNSILMQSLERRTLHEINQCGSIVVDGNRKKIAESSNGIHGLLFMDTMSNGSLITLDSQELGLHQICHMKCSFQKTEGDNSFDLSNDYTFGPSYPYERENEKASSESDATLMSSEISSISSSIPSAGLQACSSFTLNSEPKHEPLEYNKQFMIPRRYRGSSNETSNIKRFPSMADI